MLYIVCVLWNSRGEAIDSVWTHDDLAKQRAEQLRTQNLLGRAIVIHTCKENTVGDARVVRVFHNANADEAEGF